MMEVFAPSAPVTPARPTPDGQPSALPRELVSRMHALLRTNLLRARPFGPALRGPNPPGDSAAGTCAQLSLDPSH